MALDLTEMFSSAVAERLNLQSQRHQASMARASDANDSLTQNLQAAHNATMNNQSNAWTAEHLSTQDPIATQTLGANTASHAPQPQPWATPTRPVGT